ncbi:hypothetical protein ACFPK9_03605 [Rubritalea spongiae]|uniref:Lipoprotein n=1 Tax=Rubritalea spongiae TaxID=430797 RepID=A0ABW5EBL6_9BACT
MNLRLLILIPLIGSLVSCDALNEPVYYDSHGQAAAQPQLVQAPVAPDQASPAPAPSYSNAPATPPVKRVHSSHQSPPSSPFMQPDVLGLPAQEDLKETSSATPRSDSSGGLTVPSR